MSQSDISLPNAVSPDNIDSDSASDTLVDKHSKNEHIEAVDDENNDDDDEEEEEEVEEKDDEEYEDENVEDGKEKEQQDEREDDESEEEEESNADSEKQPQGIEENDSETQMTQSLEECIKKTIHSHSSPGVVLNYKSILINQETVNTADAATATTSTSETEVATAAAIAAAKLRRQEELLDSLAQQHFVEQEQKAASGDVPMGIPTMSLKSNFSEVVMNASGLGDQSYSLDFSAQHTATNPSYSSYGTYDSGPIESMSQRETYERRSSAYQDVMTSMNETRMYAPSTTSIGLAVRCASGARPNKSATASYNSYKSLKSGIEPADCNIKPVWILTKVTRYVTRTVRREKFTP